MKPLNSHGTLTKPYVTIAAALHDLLKTHHKRSTQIPKPEMRNLQQTKPEALNPRPTTERSCKVLMSFLSSNLREDGTAEIKKELPLRI